MNKKFSSFFRLIIIIFFSVYLMNISCQPSCRSGKIPQKIPLQFGQQAIINLQQHFIGQNLSFSVQPNNNYSTLHQQYKCKNSWQHLLGNIIATTTYKLNSKTKEQFIAMLGQSSSFKDAYFIYYKISRNFSNIQNDMILDDDLQVIDIPRGKVTQCSSFAVHANISHIQFVIDCMSQTNPKNKIFGFIKLNSTSPSPVLNWSFIQSPVYLQQTSQDITNTQTLISFIHTDSILYLIRLVKGQDGYLQLWRWSDQIQGKQIINIYDKNFFIVNGLLDNQDIDLIQWQISGNVIIILEYYSGLHLITLNKIGKLQYDTNLKFQYYSTFYFDNSQQILFLGKRGLIEQYDITVISASQIQIQKIQRYHLYGFEQINQIVSNSRFLYVITNNYFHMIHLTNIDFNNQQYDGTYKNYPQTFCKYMIATQQGFIKLINFQTKVRFQSCQTHPPNLYIKAPENMNRFVVNAVSQVSGYQVSCFLLLQTQTTFVDDQNIYIYGREQNTTIFTNRPGRSVIQLDKFGLGKNLQYQVILINHQINFTSEIRKVNPQECIIGTTGLKKLKRQLKSNQIISTDFTEISNQIISTDSNGDWLIVSYNQSRQRQYYKCDKYFKVQCKLVSIYNTGKSQILTTHKTFSDPQSGKDILIEASVFLDDQTYQIQVNFISSVKLNKLKILSNDQLEIVRRSCMINFHKGIQNQVSQLKIQDNKLYVLLKNYKKIQIYSIKKNYMNDQCQYFGNINLSYFHNRYFSPKSFNFDKHTLDQSIYTLTNLKGNPKKQNIRSLKQYVDTIFISQFDQILVVRLIFDDDSLQKVDLISNFSLSEISSTIQIIVSMPYLLAIDKQKNYIFQYHISHSFTPYFIRKYQIAAKGQTKLIDPFTISAVITDNKSEQTYVQIYKLNSIVSTFKQYAKWSIESHYYTVFSFKQGQFQFVQVFLSASLAELTCKSNTLTNQAYLDIVINRKIQYQPKKQQFYIKLSTALNTQKHIISLQVASDASILEKGTNYPYSTFKLKIQKEQQSKMFYINDKKWFDGNVFSHRYSCNDCKNGRISFYSKLQLNNKIVLNSDIVPSQFYVKKIDLIKQQYEFEIITGYLITRIRKQQVFPFLQLPMFNSLQLNRQQQQQQQQQNKQYRFSQTILLSSTLQQQQSCLIASHPQHSLYTVSLCQKHQTFSNIAQLQIKVHSTTGFKSFIVTQYILFVNDIFVQSSQKQQQSSSQKQQQLKLTSNTPKQLLLVDDLILVRYYNNIFMFIFDQTKNIILFDTIDKMDLNGEHLCWMEIIKRNVTDQYQQNHSQNQYNHSYNQYSRGLYDTQLVTNDSYYSLLASLCQTGIYHMVFTINLPVQSQLTQLTKIQQSQSQFALQTSNLSLSPFITRFRLILQQTIDLHIQLQYSKISLPQNSNFLQTIIQQSKDPNIKSKQFYIYTIVQNFNSFIWKIQLGTRGIPIVKCLLEGVINRYNQYTPIQVTTGDKYFGVLYKTAVNDQSVIVKQFMAVYDKNDYSIKDNFIKDYYFFQAEINNFTLYNHNKKSQIYQINNQFFILNQNNISIFNAFNAIKMKVNKKYENKTKQQNQVNQQIKQIKQNNLLIQRSLKRQQSLSDQNQLLQLYSQNIIVFVQTPTDVNSVTIRLYSIDKIQFTGWEIFSLVLLSIIILIVTYFSLRSVWRWYQKKKKLVRLTTDLEEENSSDKSNDQQNTKQRKQINRSSQVTTSDYYLGQSLIEKQQQNQKQKQKQQQQQ